MVLAFLSTCSMPLASPILRRVERLAPGRSVVAGRQVQVALRFEVDLATHMAADAAVGRHLDDQLPDPRSSLSPVSLKRDSRLTPLNGAKSAGVPNSGALPSLTPGVDGSSTGVSSGAGKPLFS